MEVGSFGSKFVFVVHSKKVMTPTQVKIINEATYQVHTILGEPPRLEFLAPALKVMTFTVLLSASWGINPLETMETIRELVDAGTVEQLVLGGKNYGKHVLTKATEDWKSTTSTGAPLSIQVSLEFKQYL